VLGNEWLILDVLFNLATVATFHAFFARDWVSPCPS
jgi:hypothetical protein